MQWEAGLDGIVKCGHMHMGLFNLEGRSSVIIKKRKNKSKEGKQTKTTIINQTPTSNSL